MEHLTLRTSPNVKAQWSSVSERMTVATLGIAAITLTAISAEFVPPLANVLEYQRAAIAQGEVWRLISGHFVHWNLDHLIWDLVTFVGLSIVCLRRSTGKTLSCVAGSALAISLGLWFCQLEIDTYRGLSGVDSALFVLLAVGVLRDAWKDKDWLLVGAPFVGLLGFLGKTLYELLTGDLLFVDSAAGSFTPLASAHILGGLVGGMIAVLGERLDH